MYSKKQSEMKAVAFVRRDTCFSGESRRCHSASSRMAWRPFSQLIAKISRNSTSIVFALDFGQGQPGSE